VFLITVQIILIQTCFVLYGSDTSCITVPENMFIRMHPTSQKIIEWSVYQLPNAITGSSTGPSHYGEMGNAGESIGHGKHFKMEYLSRQCVILKFTYY
jgi:hypothetical protein